MSIISWKGAAALGATVAGAAVAAAVAQVATDRSRNQRRARRGEAVEFGSVHSTPRAILASDGVSLNVEVDEEDVPAGAPTVVFAHGWTLDLNAWHYQRSALRGKARLVFYDQRSHGRSGRAPADACTLEHLGQDLKTIIDDVAPTGPLVLVGHSMGGMTIMSLADQYPTLVRERVVGVALMGTSAGEVMGRGGRLMRIGRPALLGGLARVPYLVDRGRRFNGYAVARRFAVGPDAPEKYADMTDEMISRARSHVLWDFFANFETLDLYHALGALPGARTLVIGGTKDQITPFRHSRKLAELIEGSELIVCEGSGHMMMFEHHKEVTEALLDLVERA